MIEPPQPAALYVPAAAGDVKARDGAVESSVNVSVVAAGLFPTASAGVALAVGELVVEPAQE